jgi:hypothetical protein
MTNNAFDHSHDRRPGTSSTARRMSQLGSEHLDHLTRAETLSPALRDAASAELGRRQAPTPKSQTTHRTDPSALRFQAGLADFFDALEAGPA